MTGGVTFHVFPPTEKSRDALRRKTSLKTSSSASKSENSKLSTNVEEIDVAIDADIRTPTLHESQLEWSDPQRALPATCTEGDLGAAQTSRSSEISQDEIRTASPATSEVTMALSGSPTLVRGNSCATERTAIEVPVTRSIFPQYDYTLPLSQQRYLPALPSPTHIPQEKINKHLSCSKDIDAIMYDSVDGSSQPRRWYSSEAHLSQLWDIANGKSYSTTPQTYSLQLHRQDAKFKPKKGSKISNSLKFGQSSLEPFYSLSYSDVKPEADDLLHNINHVSEQEVLIHRHHPSKPRSVPIAVLNLTPPPIFPRSDGYGPKKESTIITTIYPKLAALLAIDAAAHSPAASEIALLDPKATSPAAVHLAQEAVHETALRESCTLFWESDPAAATLGHYSLHHPILGTFPVALSGDVPSSFNAASTSSRPSSAANPPHRTARVEIRAPSTQNIRSSSSYSTHSSSNYASSHSPATPSSITKPSLFPTLSSLPGPLLASLDFAADTLTLNVAEILRFGNAHLLDVLVTTLLAVCVSESQRATALAAAMAFAGPPSSVQVDKLAKKAGKKGVAATSTLTPSPSFSSTTGPVSSSGIHHIMTALVRKNNNTGAGTHNFDLRDLKSLSARGAFKGKSRTRAGADAGVRGDTGRGTFQPSSEEIDHLPRLTKHILTGLGVGATAAMYTVGMAAKMAAETVVVVSEVVSGGGGGGKAAAAVGHHRR